MNFGYEGEVLHLVTIQPAAGLKGGDAITFSAKADWLVCSDVCIPEDAQLSLTLPVGVGPLVTDSRWSRSFDIAHASLPIELSGWKSTATAVGKALQIDMLAPAGETEIVREAFFYPYREEIIANAGKQEVVQITGGFRLVLPLADQPVSGLTTIEGVMVSPGGWGKSNRGSAANISAAIAAGSAGTAGSTKTAAANAAADLGLLASIAFAFLGGLILNLMPCVFPVLGIKVLGFVRHAQSHSSLLRKQGMAFFAGVVLSFWLLAALLIFLRSAGAMVGWGFQLQSPAFVTALAILFLLMALNLGGVFEFGLRLQAAVGGTRAKPGLGIGLDAFLSGVLATIVATPCTAPFMGAALGFTLTQPAYVSFIVFTAIAVGMALPVSLLSFFPRWLVLLPRPGAWMETLKQFMAFPLLATVVWLAWVLGSQQGNDGIARLLFGLVLVSMAAWLYGRWQQRRPRAAIAIGGLVAVCGLAVAWPGAPLAASIGADVHSADAWVPFSKQRIAELRSEGKGVFVDFTATWCITCQVNKRIALNQPEVIKRFSELNIVRMKADWTVQDPAITAALAEFGRNGVPLYVFYPQTGDPQVLPEVLTPSVVLTAIGANAKVNAVLN
jgi:thiol:disulfide interchange protein DsbD